MKELSIIQKTYDLIKYCVPIVNRFPKTYKFTLADRLINRLYDLLEGLIEAKYARQKKEKLNSLNMSLNIVRYQIRLFLDFQLIDLKRFEYMNRLVDEIGKELGAWLKSNQ